ncbi:MAG: L-2-amino-thiazoline-4-carboxylic acid hydrolase, partial [Candidatus Hodarchaeota archaeon]
KTVRCLWADVFEELNDPAFADAVACYKDFSTIKNINEHFVLTRLQTLVGGQDYCDACCHDIRVDKTPQHPSKEFWNNLT